MAGTEIKLTEQRRVILEELRKVRTHPSADAVYDLVRKRLPRISLGTVYRNLEAMSERGMIRKLGGCQCQMRFDADVTNHYHVRCLKCGRVDDVAVETCEVLERALRERSDYAILGHHVEFIGFCPSCRCAGEDERSDQPEGAGER
ncbi:MAG TPA: transcriptional repressor [Candidatus Brocadiia bacterium]|nr:transcriptional repressor [Candidatus Brocadiia bacterium]